MQRPWFEAVFDERYPELFGPLEGDAGEEIEGILRMITPPAGAAVEDLGCGRGRHAIPLARKGYKVTGIDISDFMLHAARCAANREGVAVEWIREDMRTFSRPGAFDLAISLFTSFGFFSDEENEKVLENIGASLKDGGALLLDLPNPVGGSVRQFDVDKVVSVPAGRLRMSARYDKHTGRSRVEHTLYRKDGIRISSAFDVRIYTMDELSLMLRAAGMTVRDFHGSLAGEPFSDESPRMVAVAVRS